jgi:hypothetical protein
VIHHWINCNECEIKSIVGNRYKCSNCEGYDLCELCYLKSAHRVDHMFMKVTTAPHRFNRFAKEDNDNDRRNDISYSKLVISKLHQQMST